MLNVKGLSLRMRLSFIPLLLLGVVSCAQNQPSLTPSATPQIDLIPYSSPTPKQVTTLSEPTVLTPTNPPSPTPTPIRYTVVEGDTMLAIALRNGIDLEDLLSVNPEVNPRLLSVGTVLVIPLGEIIPAVPMTATPLPVTTTTPDCYAAPDGVWCFLVVTNDRSRPLENISARIVLYNQTGEMIADGIGIAALNLVPVDEGIPLVVFFPGSQTDEITAFGELITAQIVPKNDDRYLNAWLEVEQVDLSDDNMQAEVNGTFGIPKKSLPGSLVWIAAIAYDAEGRVVGIRKIEEIEPIEPGDSQEFSLIVYSLGPQINEVKVFIEARP
jgi:LysM repeat protein